MSDLPRGWVKTTFSEIFDSFQYGLTAKADSTSVGTRFLRITDIHGGMVSWDFVPGLVGEHDLERYLLADGDFVFARSGSIEKAARLVNPPNAVFASYLIRGRPLVPQVADYMAHFVRSNGYLAQIADRAAGIGMSNVNAAKLATIDVCVPPLPEQRRIVAKIDSLTGKSRRARDHLDHIPRLVEKYKQAILAASFRGDAELARVGDVITDIRYGTAKKCNYDGGAVPVLRIPNVQGGRIDLRDMKSADFDTKELLKLKLRTGDILVIRSNGSLDLVGRSAVVDDRAAGMLFAGYLIRLRLDPTRCLPEYLHWFLQSSVARNTITNAAKSTSGVNNVNAQELQNLALPLPSIAAQRERIVSIVSAFTWIDRLTGEANSARKLTDYLEQSVLAKAFKGELVLQDPTDEPASALLDRIKAERAAAPKAKRGRKKAV
ncbi:MAG: restriction endonuclease subunit S [Pseudomonadales bacterium]